MDEETELGIGYRGNLGFWGGQPGSAPWWQEDMSDAGQGMYMDPETGLQTGTMPKELLEQYKKAEEDARAARGGFMSAAGLALEALGTSVDTALSNIPGWGVTKDVASEVGKALWWPVDKLASGAHWLYSEIVSQPLSTLFLQAGKAAIEQDAGVFFEGEEWSESYGKAEHLSPAQSFMNVRNTLEGIGLPTSPADVITPDYSGVKTKEERQAIARNTERFIYDTDYWRKKDGWKYTAGTGAMDFMLVMGADPTVAVVRMGAAGIKAGRSVKMTTAPATGGPISTRIGTKIGEQFAKTPEEASRSKKVNDFFDWSVGKSSAEIAQHPIWGRGRRVNPEKHRLSELYANTAREDMPLLFRFAGGDNAAMVEMAARSVDAPIVAGKLNESRVLVDSVRLDTDAFRVGQGLEPAPLDAAPVAGALPVVAPLKVGEEAAKPSTGLTSGLNGMGPSPLPSALDIRRAEEWKGNQLALAQQQADSLATHNAYYGTVFNNLHKNAEDFAPSDSNLFGIMTSAYRMGPLAVKDVNKAADKNIMRMSTGVKDYGKVGKGEAGFMSRVVRNGFYAPPIRVINSFGDRMPDTFVDHNAEDAFERVSELVKRVPGLDQEARLGMINSYANAGDKIGKSEQLDKIHAGIIEHMASKYDLDGPTARAIDAMIRDGKASTLAKLQGQRPPNKQLFSALTPAGRTEAAEGAGLKLDMAEDGEYLVTTPLAKTQLAAGQPLLDIDELDRFLKKGSGLINSMRASGAQATDAVASVADMANTMWKAATLLRPGYVLRSMSEEQAASAVKFGVMSSIMGSGQGGWNWARNRGHQVSALVGEVHIPGTGKSILGGSYVSAKGTGKGRVQILDEAGLLAAEKHGLKTEKIALGKAWPMISDRLTTERSAIGELEDLIAKERKRPTPDLALIDDLSLRIEDHNNVIGEFGDYANAILQEAKTAKGYRLGEGEIEHAGQRIPQAFSAAWENPIPRDQITSARAMETVFARTEAIEMNRLMRTGSWKTIEPDADDVRKAQIHMNAWLDGINKQYRQDPLFKLVAEDPTLAKAKAWLKTPDGKLHRQNLGRQGRNGDELLANVKGTLDSYVPPASGLQAKMAKGEEITEADLRAAVRQADFPVVHGEEFTSLTERGVIHSGAQAIDKLIEKGFKMLATVPNDIMARQPIYLRAQEARMRQFVDQELAFRAEKGMDDKLDMDTLNKILAKSDKAARKDISQVVYDPTRTTASEALRFISPFLSAHVDGLQRWGGLIAEKPEFVGQAARIYNAPVAANLVTDQSGNHVDQSGYADVIDPTTGKVVERKFVPLEERVLNFSMPDGTKNVRGKTSVPFRMSALNTILPGDPWFNPGSGPFVQMAASELAKSSPQLGDFMQWAKILPYGPNQDPSDSWIPKYAKDMWNAFTAGDSDNVAYQQAYLHEYQRQAADYANGGPEIDMKLVEKNAKQFMYLDAFLSWTMPAQNAATPLTGSPYQFFADQYKVLQEIDPKEAKAKFFAKYGADYFAFTASLSESMGVQATISADAVATQYGDLIAQDPDLAPLIIGDVYNKGGFSSSVYRKQMDQMIGGKKVRGKLTAGEAISNNQKDLGWQQYGEAMDMLDAELLRSGFHAYNQAGAEPFADAKRQIVDIIAENNDDWYEDYGTTNTTQMPLRIKAMKRMLEDENLAKDPFRNDLNGLRFYMAGRDALKAELNARGNHSLSFGIDGTPIGSNADIGMSLRSMQLMLVNNNLEFADIFHRYLENDDLS